MEFHRYGPPHPLKFCPSTFKIHQQTLPVPVLQSTPGNAVQCSLESLNKHCIYKMWVWDHLKHETSRFECKRNAWSRSNPEPLFQPWHVFKMACFTFKTTGSHSKQRVPFDILQSCTLLLVQSPNAQLSLLANEIQWLEPSSWMQENYTEPLFNRNKLGHIILFQIILPHRQLCSWKATVVCSEGRAGCKYYNQISLS